MIYAIVAVIVLILDQGLKYWTVSNIVLDTGTVPLIDGIVHLTYVRNYGAAFSILQNTRWLLVALTAVFAAVVIYALVSGLISGRFGRWSALLVLAGALGNGIDRLFMGYVVDMIELEFISFPVFNIADIFVTCDGIAFCFYIVFHRSPEPEAAFEDTRRSFRGRYREPEPPERRGGDIEMVGRASVHRRAQQPAHQAANQAPAQHAARPEPRRFNRDDPFAEWESSMPSAAKGSGTAAPAQPSAAPGSAPKPKATQAGGYINSEDSSEFDIDSILAEFKD